jgi:hypothetical protein
MIVNRQCIGFPTVLNDRGLLSAQEYAALKARTLVLDPGRRRAIEAFLIDYLIAHPKAS